MKVSQEQLYDLFDRACDLDSAAQAAFVERECAGNAALAERLTALLRAERQVSEAFLGHAVDVARSPSTSKTDPGSPEHIGPYRILREIGRGGMGVVYEAEQDRPRRRVAVKVLRKNAASEDAMKRFEREAQVLGRLSHPGIAQIYDAGSAWVGDERWPYLVMELIEGLRLDDYVQVSGVGRSARLRLVAEICDAVEHAHYHRIIHRDLKPANIMVVELPVFASVRSEGQAVPGPIAQPKILDFGVALVTEGSLASTLPRTRAGKILGTLGYMSPEQLSGGTKPVDARADVYALGVVLYLVLSGKMPYDLEGKTTPEILSLLRDEKPRSLGTVDASLRGDIDKIVAKALDKDPDRRYPSAAAFAQDIRRYLSDHPVSARPPSTWYSLAKFARRHRVFVGILAVMFVVLFTGLAAVTTAWVTARRQRDRAEAVEGFLTEVLAATRTGSPGRAVTVEGVLDRAAEQLRARFRGEPWVEARLRTTIGKAYASLGRYPKAQAHLQAAVDRWTDARGPGDLRTIDARVGLGLSLYLQGGSLKAARRHFERALMGYQRVLPADDPRLLPVLKNLASIAVREGRIREARRLFDEAVAIQGRTLDPADPVAVSLVESFSALLIRTGEYGRASALLEDHLERCRSVLGSAHAQTLAAMAMLVRLTDALVARRRFDEAESLLFGLYDSSSVEYRAEVIERLVLLYGAWQRPVAAAHWRSVARRADAPD